MVVIGTCCEDGAIHSAAGKKLYLECETLGGAKTGETKITRGYNLPAKYVTRFDFFVLKINFSLKVLHTVGPIGRDPESLRKCYRGCLELCIKHKIKNVALCGVSTGIYGYPLYGASHIALDETRKFLEENDNYKHFELVLFCTYLEKELVCYETLMPLYFPPPNQTTKQIADAYKSVFESYVPDEKMTAEVEKDLNEETAKKEAQKRRLKELTKKEEKQENQKQEETNKTKETNKNQEETKETNKKQEEAKEEKSNEQPKQDLKENQEGEKKRETKEEQKKENEDLKKD